MILKRINDESLSYNEKNIEDFINDIIGTLNFLEVEKRMKLIDDDKDDVNSIFNV